jgi:hypothetical protein
MDVTMIGQVVQIVVFCVGKPFGKQKYGRPEEIGSQ